MSSTILVIDDDQENVDYLKILLEKNNFRVITAYDGTSGLNKALETTPDLIILDIDMPNMDGHQVCQKIRKEPATQNIPVIMVTSSCNGKDMNAAYAEGANWYIIKPFDHEYLLNKLISCVHGKYGY